MNPLAKEYDGIYTRKEHYRGHYTKSPYHKVWLIASRYIPKGSKVVELGCGTGQLMELLLDKGIREYTGYDFSQVAIDLAFSRVQGRNARLCYTDLYEIDELPDADIYAAIEVMEHLKGDADQMLINIIPIGKKVVISVPNYLGGSHVRRFMSTEDIQNRYPNLKITDHHIIGSTETKIFVILGEKQ